MNSLNLTKNSLFIATVRVIISSLYVEVIKLRKTKLTLYIDEDVSKKAKKVAQVAGKSISVMVKDYFNQKEAKIVRFKISDPVNKWVGMLETSKSYRELRNEIMNDKIEKR